MTKEDILVAIEEVLELMYSKSECEAYVKGYLDALFELGEIDVWDYEQLVCEARKLYD